MLIFRNAKWVHGQKKFGNPAKVNRNARLSTNSASRDKDARKVQVLLSNFCHTMLTTKTMPGTSCRVVIQWSCFDGERLALVQSPDEVAG